VTKHSPTPFPGVGESIPINKPIPVNKKINISILNLFFTTKTIPISFEKEKILLLNALESYKSGQFTSIQAAASHFSVSKWKLQNQNNGKINRKGRTTTKKALNSL
jgi:hypothetical protein